MKYLTYILVGILLMFSACSEEESETENNQNTEQNHSVSENPETEEYLTIEGNDIWVRNAAGDGEVIMKLDNGNQCLILEKGEEETINGYTDFWYKIDFEGKTGWVFGSQTSVKTGISSEANSISEEEKTIAEIESFVGNLHKNHKEIADYFFDRQGVLLINNQGVYQTVVLTTNLSVMESLLEKPFNCDMQFRKWPDFDFERSVWKSTGCFAEKVRGDKRFQTVAQEMKEYDLPVSDFVIQRSRELGKQIRVKILNTQTNVRYYLGRKNNNWYLIGIDISDFSS